MPNVVAESIVREIPIRKLPRLFEELSVAEISDATASKGSVCGGGCGGTTGSACGAGCGDRTAGGALDLDFDRAGITGIRASELTEIRSNIPQLKADVLEAINAELLTLSN